MHTNGIEPFRALLKRGYYGIYQWMSPQRLHRYRAEFAGRYNLRQFGTLDRLALVFDRMVGKSLTYRALTSH